MLALFPTGVLAKITLCPTGVVVGMATLIKKLFVCMFFSPDPTPFAGSGELCSRLLYQNITFVHSKFLCFFIDLIQGTDYISQWFMFKQTIKGISRKNISTFFFLEYCHLWFFITLKNKKVIANVSSSLIYWITFNLLIQLLICWFNWLI